MKRSHACDSAIKVEHERKNDIIEQVKFYTFLFEQVLCHMLMLCHTYFPRHGCIMDYV